MFRLEDTDRDVLDNPGARIVDSGGVILFAQDQDLGIVGTCALQKTGERQFEAFTTTRGSCATSDCAMPGATWRCCTAADPADQSANSRTGVSRYLFSACT